MQQQLISKGMSVNEAANKAEMFARVGNALRENTKPKHAYFVPGRIEFLGKHTDYAGGRSLICTIEKGFCVITMPRDDAMIHVFDVANNLRVEFPFSENITPTIGDWSNYPMTVARRIAKNFSGELRGTDIAFLSDIPTAAGISSSSAFVVAIFSALADVNLLHERDEYNTNIHSKEDLADYLGAIENGLSFRALTGDKGVGTFGGSQDQTAILCCRANHLSQYSFCPVRHEEDIALPDDYVFVIGVSGVVSEKTGDALEKYNRASLMTKEILKLWNETTKQNEATLASVVKNSHKELRGLLSRPFSSQSLLNRFNQFYIESEIIIPAVAEALKRNEIEKLGLLIDRSQSNAETLLGNQIEETIYLARSARERGAIAASAFGAGFGGSVYALVRKDSSESFTNVWAESYRKKFPSRVESSFFTTKAAPSLTRFSVGI
jgi:galactokinase